MRDRFSDPGYLRGEQYQDASNLDRRVSLHERFSTHPQPWHEWVFDQLLIPNPAEILEVGCGPGRLWAQNSSRVPGQWKITLSDFSVGMLKTARRRLIVDRNRALVSLDVQHVPIQAQQFDVVIANHMLYHVPSTDRALSEIVRVLKPGGALYAATNGEHHLRELAELVQQSAGSHASEQLSAFRKSVDRFSLQSGASKLARYFEAVEIRHYPDSLRVTEAKPLVQFVASSSVFQLSEQGLARLETLVQRAIRTKGAIEISKETGVFIARAP